MNLRTLFVAFLLAAPGWASVVSAEGELSSFQGEAKFELEGIYGKGRQPNVVVAMDGTVLATFVSAETLLVRRSEDGGKTWSAPITLGKYKHLFSGGGVTVDEKSGNIFVFAERYRWPANPPPPTVYRSGDHGKTWKVQETVIHPTKSGHRLTMHMAEHGITLRRGKHKGRLLRPARYYGKTGDRRENFPKMYNTAIYSDDGGKTWLPSSPFPVMGTGEGCVAELSDGRIYYDSRRHWDPPGSKYDRSMRWYAWSDDGGVTWKEPAISKVLPDGARGSIGGGSGCMAGLVRLPVKDRDILLYSSCDSQGGDRKDVSVWASFDGAKTWPLKRRVYKGPSAYSSLSAGRPGAASEGWIYILLEGGPNYRYGGGQFARFNLSWVLRGERTGDGEPPKE